VMPGQGRSGYPAYFSAAFGAWQAEPRRGERCMKIGG
jgi:hypothetical protein